MRPPKSHVEQVIEAEVKRLKRNGGVLQPKERVAILDQKALLNIDPSRILIDEIEVYDPRDQSDDHS
jgi:hypothetical protein